MVGTFLEPSCGRMSKPIHSISYSVAQPLERGFNNYYSIIQGVTDRDADGPTEQAQQKGTAEVLRREARFLAWNQPGLQNHTEQEGL